MKARQEFCLTENGVELQIDLSEREMRMCKCSLAKNANKYIVQKSSRKHWVVSFTACTFSLTTSVCSGAGYNAHVGLSFVNKTSFESYLPSFLLQYRLTLYLDKAVCCITVFRHVVLGSQRHC